MGFCVASTKKGSGSGCVSPEHGHAPLLHGLEQRRLRLGRGAVDLVRQHEVREERPLVEDEHAPAVAVLEHGAAGDVAGQQVGRELHAREGELEQGRERLDELGLAQARQALEQHVAARRERDDDEVEQLVLAEDHARQLVAQPAQRGLRPRDVVRPEEGLAHGFCSKKRLDDGAVVRREAALPGGGAGARPGPRRRRGRLDRLGLRLGQAHAGRGPLRRERRGRGELLGAKACAASAVSPE
jgi:hypothetical protein